MQPGSAEAEECACEVSRPWLLPPVGTVATVSASAPQKEGALLMVGMKFVYLEFVYLCCKESGNSVEENLNVQCRQLLKYHLNTQSMAGKNHILNRFPGKTLSHFTSVGKRMSRTDGSFTVSNTSFLGLDRAKKHKH